MSGSTQIFRDDTRFYNYLEKEKNYNDLVINGNMILFSDRVSATNISHRSSTADHWLFGRQGGSSTWNFSRENDTPDNTVPYSLKLTCGTAESPVNSSAEAHLRYALEGIEVRPYKDSYLTLKFFVKSNVVGKYTIAVTNSARDKTFLHNYQITQQDVWEEKTIQIPLLDGTGSGTWQFDEGTFGLGIRWALLAGTLYQGNPGWNNGNFVGTSDQTNLGANVNNYLQLTKVRLYPGKSDEIPRNLDYIGKSLQETRLLCSRYYKCFKVQTAGVNFILSTGGAVTSTVNFDFLLNISMYKPIDIIFRGTLNSQYSLHDLETGANLVATAVSSFARSTDCMKFSIAAPTIITGRMYSLRILDPAAYLIADAEL